MKQIDLEALGNRKIRKSISLSDDMLYSEAFRKLTKTAMHVLFRFLQKRTWDGKKIRYPKQYSDFENGGLPFPYSEAKALGIDERSFTNALDQLSNLGFIEQEWQGGTFGSRRDYSRFKYIEEWKNYGKGNFNPKPRKKATKYSIGFEKYNRKRKPFSTVESYCDSQQKSTVAPQ